MSRVLITGGGTGIGRGIAEAAVAAGHEVVITGRRPGPLAATAAALGCAWVAGDVTAEPERIVAEAGPLDHLVNNAGRYVHAPLGRWTAADWAAMFALHATAPALLAQAFAAQNTDGGAIVNIGSTLSERPVAGAGPYAAAKAAMVGLTRALAVELAPRRIRANCLLPGVVHTEMTAAPRDGDDPAARLAALEALHPIGRLGTPADVGAAVCWLLGATWVTGTALPVDGGLVLA